MLTRSIRPLAAPLLLLAVSLLLPACGLFGSSQRLPDIMPNDFRFVHSVHSATQPAVDYTLTFERSGSVTYDTFVRAPRRDRSSGAFEVSEDHLQNIYTALLAANFDELPAVMHAEPGTEQNELGARAYFVRADGDEIRVEAEFLDIPELAMIRTEMLKEVPDYVFTAKNRVTEAAPSRFVAESVNQKFHRGECKVLSATATGQRRDFDTMYDALNFGFDPCEVCDPMPSRTVGR